MKNVTLLPHQTMDAYVAARELARAVIEAKIANPILRDQAERAVTSVFLQLAEGLPNDSGPMRRKYFTCARNSLFELVGATDLARIIGALRDDAWCDIQERASRANRQAHGASPRGFRQPHGATRSPGSWGHPRGG
jgi:four helix bundle protein